MAEAFPSAILDSVLKSLLFQPNYKLSCGLGIQLRDLRSTLELIRSVIDDAEFMGMLFPELVREWVCELQCILHEADDLMDEALTRSLPESNVIEKVRLRLHRLPFDLTLARKMKNINERLEGIVKQCYKCNLLVERGGSEKPIAKKGILRYVPNDNAKDDEPLMIGRDDHKKDVIQMLFDEEPSKAAIWITGPPGVGKTTLCRAVYNDEEVRKHFDVRIWFGLEDGKEFRLRDLWNKIITTLDESQPHNDLDTEEEDYPLIKKIIALIWTRKMLLVLDSFPPCNHNYPSPFGNIFWLRLKNWDDSTYGGTKILAPSMESPADDVLHYPRQELKLKNDLSEEHCWCIFKNTALVPRHDREEWIEGLGKQIARRCLGNPALLRGVGTLLHGKESEKDRDTWEHFAHKFDFKGQYDHYHNASSVHYLFQLFQHSVGYLSLFSENDIKYEALMDQFVANGFTNLSDTMQQRFKRHFLLHITEKGDWDEAGRLRYHPDYRAVIMQLAGTYITSLGWEETDLPKAARHVSFSRPSSSTDPQQKNIVLKSSLINDAMHKRSLLFLGKWHPVRLPVQTLDALASNLRYVRVLDLQDLALKELPSSIGKLLHLRYLDLSRNDFKELPRSVCRLRNLLTLRLFYCDKLIRLPGRIKNLHRLKHLEIGMCLDCTHMPPRIANLTSLQRLDRFIVGPRKGGLRYLGHLNNLKGHLTIELPRQWEKSTEDAEKANLDRKEGLTALEFKWQGTDNGKDDNDDDGVLEKLKPCSSIENLSIINFGGITFPRWIALANHLTRVTISHCNRCKILPPFHGLPNLRYLTLTSMMNIEYLQNDSSSSGDTLCDVRSSAATRLFPPLSELNIGCMPKLIGWSRDSDWLTRRPVIHSVQIWKCPRLMVACFSIKSLSLILRDVSEKILQSIDRHPKSMQIISTQDMVSLPNNMVVNLPEDLTIEDCKKWQSFWTNEIDRSQTWESLTRGFQRLKRLSMKNCREMKHLSGGLRHLVNLEWLYISGCSEELDCLHEEEDEDGMVPWKALRLSSLIIEGFDNLEAIPKGFRQLHSLLHLTIKDCKSLKRGLDSLPKVKHLYIKSCPRFVQELRREHPDVTVTDEEVRLDWLSRSKPFRPIEEAIASTSQTMEAP